MSRREYLIEWIRNELKIPGPDIDFKIKEGFGFCDPGFFARHNEEYKLREAMALAEIDTMTDEELEVLRNDQGQVRKLESKHELNEPPPWYSAGLCVEGFEPDWQYWGLLKTWTLHEATCLSLGCDPHKLDYAKIAFIPSSIRGDFVRRREIIARSQALESFGDPALDPKLFATWASENDLKCPKEMLAVSIKSNRKKTRPAMLTEVDARLYDSALKVIIGLLCIEHGEDLGGNSPALRKEISDALAKIGMSIDRKTLVNTLNDVSTAKKRFQAEIDSRS